MGSKVIASRCDNYDEDILTDIIRGHIAAICPTGLLAAGKRVLLKPNLLMRRDPELATTTHPALVGAVINVLREYGVSDITLADSPGGPFTARQLASVYGGTGMAELAKRKEITLSTDTTYGSVRSEAGERCREFSIISAVTNADVVINLPKLKTHAMTVMSAAVKNLFGCVPGLQKPQMHTRFPDTGDFGRMLVDLALIVRPALTIVDAIVAMEGEGPSAGKLKNSGYVFSSGDVFGLDLALCQFMGLEPADVPTVMHSLAAGLCTEVDYEGEAAKPQRFQHPHKYSVKFSDKVPGFMRPVVARIEKDFAPRPVIVRRECIGCAKCAESCAPEAIDMVDRKAVINRSKCIKCFCCHEMCPVSAIKIRSNGIFKL